VIAIGVLLAALFLSFSGWGIYAGDSGDLVTAGYLFGVPHPPGYPLYTLLTYVATRIPFATVAFRAAALSAVFHATAAAVVFILVKRLTKQWWSGLFAVLLLAGNYVFFLYSVTPEVFALFDLFVVGIVFLTWRLLEKPSTSTLAQLAFIMGLSLSHHHLILFLFPAVGYVVWKKRKNITWRFRHLGLFLLGLVPHLYIPIAARTQAIINWNNASDVPGFFKLVTRASYGTFRSGAVFGEALGQRFVQVTTYFRFVVLDFGWVGAILAILGVWYLWKKHRLFAQFLLLGIFFLGPFYFFYASFPLVNRFMLGTYERFLLPSYMLLALCAGAGVALVGTWARRRLLAHAVVAVLFLLPLVLLAITLYRFWGLPADRTADTLGRDVLETLPASGPSVLLVSRDTMIFTTQYMRYTQGVRSDVPVVAAGQLADPGYQKLLARNFPSLVVPDSQKDFLSEFINQNAQTRRIFTNIEIPMPEGWVRVPYGVVYEVVREQDAPSVEGLREKNLELWSGYQRVSQGILGRYNHLMLADVRDAYAAARLALGKTYVRADKIDWAAEEFRQAVALAGDTTTADAYTYLGLSELWLENCDAALEAFARARTEQFVPNEAITLYESVTYKDCVGDPARAQEMFNQYENERKAAETPLDTL
jgi:hypothetical protein